MGRIAHAAKFGFLSAARSDQGQGDHWSDYILRRGRGGRALGLIEFCKLYDEVELWFDPTPSDQLQLIWLLDFFSSDPDIASKLKIRLLDIDFSGAEDAFLAKGNIPAIPVTTAVFETASLGWQAYRSATPEACFDVLKGDLSALPLLRPALADLLKELPGPTGLGATELRLLELVGAGYRRQVHCSIIGGCAARGCSVNMSLATFLMVWHMDRCRRWRDSMRPGHSAGKISAIVYRPISVASCRSPTSAERFFATRQTSAATIRSTAGGAART